MRPISPQVPGPVKGDSYQRPTARPRPADIIAGLPLRFRPHVRNHDLVFLKHFSQVIAFLVVITIALILLGFYINGLKAPEPNPVAEAATLSRIQPAGAVYAGATGAAAQAAAAAEAAQGAVAFDGTLDGSVIYAAVCTGCHGTGALNAPKLEAAAWTARIAQGNDILYKHAIEGYTGAAGVMPAKGGMAALSDEQVKVTVDWMLAQLK
jgi:cytochrome c5